MTDRPRRILFVDGRRKEGTPIRALFPRGMEGGCTITYARDLTSALRWLAQEEVDCVLIDSQVLKSLGLRGLVDLHQAAQRVPVIVLPDQQELESVKQVLARQAVEYAARRVQEGEDELDARLSDKGRRQTRRSGTRPGLRRSKTRGKQAK